MQRIELDGRVWSAVSRATDMGLGTVTPGDIINWGEGLSSTPVKDICDSLRRLGCKPATENRDPACVIFTLPVIEEPTDEELDEVRKMIDDLVGEDAGALAEVLHVLGPLNIDAAFTSDGDGGVYDWAADPLAVSDLDGVNEDTINQFRRFMDKVTPDDFRV